MADIQELRSQTFYISWKTVSEDPRFQGLCPETFSLGSQLPSAAALVTRRVLSTLLPFCPDSKDLSPRDCQRSLGGFLVLKYEQSQ